MSKSLRVGRMDVEEPRWRASGRATGPPPSPVPAEELPERGQDRGRADFDMTLEGALTGRKLLRCLRYNHYAMPRVLLSRSRFREPVKLEPRGLLS